ncbi:MAG: hypothetical protein JXK08_11585 [Flavobacteriaceae bacterium]|nr:hypothetical protein [Flavobacteriaceae bacterium]
MKKLLFLSILSLSMGLTSCIQDDDTPIIIEVGGGNGGGSTTDPQDVVINKTGLITQNETWTKDNIYRLNQKVVVDAGVTLTIQEGTIIKGSPGTGSLASVLIVARGGMINAVGTPAEPIIFTSTSDNIQPGQTSGTNLSVNDRGLWGGVLLLGKAPCSFSGDVEELQIEGIPADDTFGLYGGTEADDSSGVMQYVSIRHGGALIGEGNEINGLTLGGVGNGTVLDNIEVVANVDDGIEFFGGTVNATNLLVWGQGDDGLDIDQAYAGTIDNAVVALGDVSDHAFEIDGPEGSATGSFLLENATIIGNLNTNNGEYADFRKGATGTINNIYAYGFKDDSDVELDADADATNYNNGTLIFSNWEIVLPTAVTNVEDIFVNKAENVTVTGFGSEATAVSQGSQTVGASTSELSWTYANAVGNLGF